MADEHPESTLLQSVSLLDTVSAKDAFSEDFVRPFFDPQLPDIQGDDVGLAGLDSFFEKVRRRTKGS